MHAGLAKGHRANPAASLRVETVFAVPVLLSGMACLVLSSKEEKFLNSISRFICRDCFDCIKLPQPQWFT